MADTQHSKPIECIIGWIPRVEKAADAIAFTKRQIELEFATPDISWYAVAPFNAGYLYEIHHGGSGKGYLKSLIENLKSDPDGKYWAPSGSRAVQVIMQDGDPLPLILPEDDARRLVRSGQPSLPATTPLKPAVNKGATTMYFGCALFGTGLAFMLATCVFYIIGSDPGSSLREIKVDKLPHTQWSLVSNIQNNEIVDKLELRGGKWSISKSEHEQADLKNAQAETLKQIQLNREGYGGMTFEDEKVEDAERVESFEGEHHDGQMNEAGYTPDEHGHPTPNFEAVNEPPVEDVGPRVRRKAPAE